MKRTIALVGRPNVGKSTFFNCVTNSRDALVAPEPGLTRDRRYGMTTRSGCSFIVIDTGGLTGESDEINQLIAGQVDQAIIEADVIFFLLDAKETVNSLDEQIARKLRAVGKPVWAIVNKSESLNKASLQSEFSIFGFQELHFVSAAHGNGIDALFVALGERFPDSVTVETIDDLPAETVRVAVIGRPNVGKSTLINRIIGEERVLAFDMPGTTRDSIDVPFEHEGHSFVLVDTAGVRRRSRIDDKIEKFSVVKTLQAIESAHVVIFVLDAQQGVAHQDADLVGFAIDQGKGILIAVNKWDGLTEDQKNNMRREMDLNLSFVTFAKTMFISALHGTGVGLLLNEVKKIYDSAHRHFATPMLTKILEDALQTHQPPLVGGRRIKLRYAHQGGKNPPVIVIHGNQTQSVPDSYKRFLSNTFRTVLDLYGTPMRIEFKGSENPYRHKKNVLTKRQIAKRKRLVKHIKSRKR